MEPSPVHSDEDEVESDEDSTTSTEPERENEENVSNLWQIVRGISQVLTKLEESNTRIVEQLGLNAFNTSARTPTTEKLFCEPQQSYYRHMQLKNGFILMLYLYGFFESITS